MNSSSRPTEDDLASVNVRLCEIVRENGWTRTNAIGELIVDRMFGGTVDALGEPGRASKHPSIRQLASRPDCPLKKTALAQAIAVYAVVQKEPRLRQLAGITPAHVAVVMSLPGEERYERLVQAEREKWSVRVLSRTVERPTSEDDAESRPAPARQALTHYRNGLKSAQQGLRVLKQQAELDPAFGKELSSVIRALTQVLSETGDVVRAVKRPSDSQADEREERKGLMLAGIGIRPIGQSRSHHGPTAAAG
jgi:hypothetical protein